MFQLVVLMRFEILKSLGIDKSIDVLRMLDCHVPHNNRMRCISNHILSYPATERRNKG